LLPQPVDVGVRVFPRYADDGVAVSLREARVAPAPTISDDPHPAPVDLFVGKAAGGVVPGVVHEPREITARDQVFHQPERSDIHGVHRAFVRSVVLVRIGGSHLEGAGRNVDHGRAVLALRVIGGGCRDNASAHQRSAPPALIGSIVDVGDRKAKTAALATTQATPTPSTISSSRSAIQVPSSPSRKAEHTTLQPSHLTRREAGPCPFWTVRFAAQSGAWP